MKGSTRLLLSIALAALAIGAVAACWQIGVTAPYRIPPALDGVAPELRVLHVEKRGLAYSESQVNVFRDGIVYLEQDRRRLFQNRIKIRLTRALLSHELLERVRATIPLLVRGQQSARAAKPLRAWNAEGWYVIVGNLDLFSFTTENHATPPQQLTDIFFEIHMLPTEGSAFRSLRGTCLGFCFDPFAQLDDK